MMIEMLAHMYADDGEQDLVAAELVRLRAELAHYKRAQSRDQKTGRFGKFVMSPRSTQGEGDIASAWQRFVGGDSTAYGYFYYEVLGPFWWSMQCDLAERNEGQPLVVVKDPYYKLTSARFRLPKEIGISLERIKTPARR